jgi:hypothetical protein
MLIRHVGGAVIAWPRLEEERERRGGEMPPCAEGIEAGVSDEDRVGDRR